MDQCTHCTVKGDIAKCEKTECSIHETWYVQTLKLFPRHASQQVSGFDRATGAQTENEVDEETIRDGLEAMF